MLEHLDQLVVKRAFPTEAREPVFGRKLSDREKSLLAAELRARPDHFVGQEQVALSAAPVWHRHRMEPRPVVFRTYVAAAGDSYAVMPGGLTRVSSTHDVPIVSMQRGGGSKDTWVLSDGPVSSVTLLAPAGSAMRPERAGSDLPSRVAESLFWLGRYAERAEHAIRLLRSVVARLTDLDTTDPRELSALLHVLVELEDAARALRGARCRCASSKRTCSSFIFKENPHAGLRQTLNELRRIAAVVRDRLSIDTWRILNQLHQDLRLRHGRVQFDDVLAHLNRMITDLAAFSGMEMENMTRGHGWRFLDVGRRLERAMNATSLVRQALSAGPSDNAVLEPLLEIADSSMTYRRRYFARPQLSPVLDLLLLDDTNTRALAFQLAAVSEHVRHLPRDPKAPSPTREERLIDQAVATLRQVDPHTVHRDGDEGARRGDGAARLDRGRPARPVGDDHLLLLQSRGAPCQLTSSRCEYEVVHTTEYDYSESVAVSHHLARLSPRVLPHQQRLHHDLQIEPAPAAMTTHTDYFGNAVTFFAMQGAHKRLTVRARSRVALQATSLPSPSDTPPWEAVADRDGAAARRAGVSVRLCADSGERRTGRLRARVLPAGQAAARRGPRADAPNPRRLHVRSGGDDRQRRRWRTSSSRGAACVRTSRGWRSRACGRSGCRPGTSAGISRPSRPRAARDCSAPTRRTPGWRSTVPGPAGSTSTPPTTCCHRARTSPWPGGATTAMSARSTA